VQIEIHPQFLQPAALAASVTEKITGVGTADLVTIATAERFLPVGLGTDGQRDAAQPEKNFEQPPTLSHCNAPFAFGSITRSKVFGDQ